ncbi:MAG: Gfo/Idh/MocA family oxidoreductase [Planctomycetaceae bacterium]|nr:Gfo/Idh/MocA family oxidoreductase [Planctomycetaceae bacterium]
MAHTGFGIVGCGMIANFHAEAIKRMRNAKIIACTDTFPASAERFAAANPGVKPYATLDQMLKDPVVQIVTICTPSGSHRDPAVKAANAGKHVVVEKPMEITLKRCDDILNACQKNGVQLCPIFPSRFSPANIALKDAIDDGRFGRLTLGDTYVKWWRTQQYYDQGGWRGTWTLDGGGSYMNQAIHNVDLLYWFMGDVAEVCGATSTLAHERIEVEDVGVAAIKFQSGALGVIEATTAAWPGLLKKTEIHGTEGTVIVEQDDVLRWEFAKPKAKDKTILEKFAKKVGGTGGAADPKAISYVGHMEQLKDFVKAVESGKPPRITGAEGRKAVEIILAIYQSSWTGKRVPLPLAKDPKRAK